MSQTERIYFIHSTIKRKGAVPLSDIFDRFEVDPRTAKRDIQYMRERMNAPISFSRSKGGYYYSKTYNLLDFADEKMLLSYIFMESISQAMTYIPIISDDLLEQIRSSINRDYVTLRGLIHYELPEYEKIDIKNLHTMLEAILNKKQIQIAYINSAGVESTREIEPQRLINYSGKWYLIAFCTKSSAMRTFLISRIQSLKISEKPHFHSVSNKDMDSFVDGSFGIFKSRDVTQAHILFHPPAYHMVKNQIWHKKQVLNKQETDSGTALSLKIPVSHYLEIMGIVMKYAPHAEIIEPQEFRDRWLETIEQMHEQYCLDASWKNW